MSCGVYCGVDAVFFAELEQLAKEIKQLTEQLGEE